MSLLTGNNTHGSAVDRAFSACRSAKRAAFIPFLTAGDPSLARTPELLQALVDGGADIVELGVPFSDPIADGPVNQRAAWRALQAGTNLSGILQMISRCREQLGVPIVLFTYFNPIHARGIERFAEQASDAGVDGVLCVDLPPEAGQELIPALTAKGIDVPFLLAPTSTRDRIQRVAQASTGFVYYVSRTGVTGAREALPEELLHDVRKIRRRVRLPIAVGFGISSPDQVDAVGKVADGVVVGSALVRLVEENVDDPQVVSLLGNRVRELTAPLRQTKSRGLFGRRD